MRRIMTAVFAACAMLVVLASTASAQDYLGETKKALQQATVYVAKGTENTDSGTARYLTNQLSVGDNIVLVMLPSAAKVAPDDANSFAKKLDDATEHRHIVAVSIGDDIGTSTTLLPDGIAADMLQRAGGVATSTKETLGIFARNIHGWQHDHPEQVKQPEAPPSAGTSDNSGGFPWWIFGVLGAIVCLVAFGAVKSRGSGQRSTPDKVRIGAPNQIKDELQQILDYRVKLNDPGLSNTLTQLIRDTNRVFDQLRRNAPQQVDEVTEEFEQHLQSLCKVLESYVDIQNNRRYYEDPQQALSDGREAVNGFAEYVLTSAQRAGKRTLTSFNVDTKILSAQRYR